MKRSSVVKEIYSRPLSYASEVNCMAVTLYGKKGSLFVGL